MEIKDINIKSEEVEEILGTPPSSILRWGVSVIFFAVMMLLVFSYVIQYPDVVKGAATITTQNPPIKVNSFATGNVLEIFVKDQEKVLEKQKLALIENTASYKDVLKTEKLILELDTATNISEISFSSKRKSLGEIQNEYNNFLSTYNTLIFFYENNVEAETNKSIISQINQVENQYKRLLNQKFLLTSELKILEKQINERKALLDKNVISKEDYEAFKVEYFQKKQLVENLKIRISENRINKTNLKSNISNNSYTRVFKDNETLMKFEEAKDLLISRIEWWKKKYLIIAPISGYIAFDKINTKNQRVNTNENIFTIVPETNQIIAKIKVPMTGIGKLKNGQKILLDLMSYPSAEFGYLESEIKNISLIPNEENLYLIEAKLPEKLITSYDKEIPFKSELQGTASIITAKKRISDRIFEKFRALSKSK